MIVLSSMFGQTSQLQKEELNGTFNWFVCRHAFDLYRLKGTNWSYEWRTLEDWNAIADGKMVLLGL